MSAVLDPAKAAPGATAGPVPPGARFGPPEGGWRLRLYRVIFESETPAGRAFDVALIVAILSSVAAVMAESVDAVNQRHGAALQVLEWLFTALFTAEYALRLACVRHPLLYARSFFGVVDLLSILPAYVSLLWPGAHYFLDVRVLRLLRIFRIFKLVAYVGEYRALALALAASRRKILVFLSIVLMVVLVMGTLMYVVEGPANGYTSIPVAVYWAIVTMTTVGYGDIAPKTDLGRVVASMMMLLGWGILAVPTGIVSAEMTALRFGGNRAASHHCPACGRESHEPDATYCSHCGAGLREPRHDGSPRSP